MQKILLATLIAVSMPAAAADIKWRRNPAGSYVVHDAKKIHYDGAKGEERVIQVWGMGPATSTPAEKK